MEAVVKPEPVWLMEDQAVTDAGIKKEAPISDDRNEDMKPEIDVEEHSILEEGSELHLCVEMEGVVKPETVWLLEDQAVLDDMRREVEAITCTDITDEFLRTDAHSLKHIILLNNAGIKEEAPASDDEKEDMKIEIDIEEHSILEESSKYIPSHKGPGITGAQECRGININTDKPDCTVTKRMKSHTEDRSFKCEVCSKCFTQRRHLADHVKTHTGDRFFKCEVCSKSFSRRSNLSDHIRTHTGDKPFKCEVCNKCFSRRSHLTDHVRTHTGDKPFKCEVCSMGFSQHSNLTDHIRTHTGYKPFKCEVCSKCFTQRSTLIFHIRTHTADKRFKCEVCSKCFTHRNHLTDHIRTHTGDKPFKCEVCSKFFSYRVSLSRHIKTHTGDKCFKCEMCSKSFTWRSTLTRHIRTHARDSL